MCNIDIKTISLNLYSFIFEGDACIALELRDQDGDIIGLELVWGKELASCAVKVIVLRPRSFPLPSGMVAVKGAVIIDQIFVSVCLVDLIGISKIVFPSFKDNGLRCLFIR
jgi:hypothetical protein